MKPTFRILALLLLNTTLVQSAEPVAKQFLRYIYGADDINFTNICHPTDDVWMLRGAKDVKALAELDKEKFDGKRGNVFSGTLGTDIYFVELQDGRVNPAFNLESIHSLHRKLVLTFIYSALSRDGQALNRLVTDPKKIEIVGPKAAPGDMDQYLSIIELMPVVRSSKPADDAKSRTVTYRVPIGDAALSLTLLKDGSIWKIDTSKPVRVPMEFFFR